MENIAGCKSEEIKEIEEFYALTLPATYREWLAIYGRQPTEELVGSDCHYPVLLKLKEDAWELLKECGNPFILEEDDFVFLMHQGYQFFYFKSDGESNDPPVYYYFEGWDKPKLIANSFTEWWQTILLDSV